MENSTPPSATLDVSSPEHHPSSVTPNNNTSITVPMKYEESPNRITLHETERSDIQEETEYEESSLSISEVEKEMIIKALERHKGKRKLAAADLGISERTLYRKIKEYNLGG